MDRALLGVYALISAVIRSNVNALVNNRNSSLTKSGHSQTIYVPMVVSEDIAEDTILDVSNVWEKNLAMKVKGLIENNIFSNPQQLQSGNIMSYLPYKKIEGTNGRVSLDIGDIGEDVKTANFIKEVNEDMYNTRVMNMSASIREAMKDSIISHSAGTSTFLEIEVNYITDKNEIKTVKNTIEIRVNPRRVSNADLATIVSKHDSSRMFKKFVKLTAGEDKFLKDYLLEMDEIKKQAKLRADGGKEILSLIDKEAMKKKFSLGYSYPFASMLVSETFVDEMFDIAVDMKDDAKLHKLMDNMLLLNFGEYNVSLDLIRTMEHGLPMSHKVALDDYTADVSKMEKELKQLVRLSR